MEETDAIMPTSLELTLSISYSGQSHFVTMTTSSTLSSLQAELEQHFNVPVSAQKLLMKGRKLDTTNQDVTLCTFIGTSASSSSSSSASSAIKLLLIGPHFDSLKQLQQRDELQASKRAAFEYHKAHRPPPVAKTGSAKFASLGTIEDQGDMYKFHRIAPFPPQVPSEQARKKMLDKLDQDPGVKWLMKQHRFVVGTLTELHPLKDPTILGLNKNAGQEICLRLLTDDLSGTRAYLDVRKVLLHELAHNRFGPQYAIAAYVFRLSSQGNTLTRSFPLYSDNDFKELNSLLNRELNEYETKHGLITPEGLIARSRAWEPDPSQQEKEEPKRTARRLDEEEEEKSLASRVRDLKWIEEEEVEMRRERVRIAAEERMRRQAQG
ncbi:BZ3500_MvSof-1268-A1-R1_Chr6-3g08701 [Microbotryum saponariae]|uniref:BZ3500_MvSof-1268-A1-R1_Chr6-3g08701 protein n=1 Tax=Microbotryum saponariae TaxID=289078 RepID=A0A2X0KJ83_9BASI|nr:BZ3500_MvSof-1268-A1-R1_Chr6-3g08701 [Microbotryum saponariae]SDA07302.1 BZ3501_MvSof-1269-A2-R1_Chr6-2g08404 [Microbotryum saponariae]